MNLTFTAEVELYHLSKVVFSSLLHCKLFGVFFLFKLEVSFEKTIWGDVIFCFLSDFESMFEPQRFY